MREKETTCQVKDINKVLRAIGIRVINGNIAETPEKLPERSRHGRQDRSGIIDTLQNIHPNNVNSI
jgi:hypothetical protein